MSNHQLPSNPIPHSTILWYLRKSQLQRLINEFQHDYAILLSFEIRYNDVFGKEDPQETMIHETNNAHVIQKFSKNKHLFKKVALLLHPDHIINKLDKDERYDDMIRASYAYHSGDEQELEMLFQKWNAKENGSYVKENIEIEAWTSELYSICIKIAQLHRSSMWALAQKELEYALLGRDLFAELVTILQHQNQ